MEERETEFPVIAEQCFTANTASLHITPPAGEFEAAECATPSEKTANSVCTAPVSDSNKAKIFPDAAEVAGDATVDTDNNPSKLKAVPCLDVDKLQIISNMGQSVAETATTVKICDESPLKLEVKIFPDAAEVAGGATVDTDNNPSKLNAVPCVDVDKLQIISDMGGSVAETATTVKICDETPLKEVQIFPDAAEVAGAATVDTDNNPSKLKAVPCEDVDKLQIISDTVRSIAEAAATAKICDESPLKLEVEVPNNYMNVAIKEELLSSDEDELFVFEGGTYTSVKMEPNIKTEEVDLKDEVVNRNFECPQCHKTFYLECLYLYHMITHEGVKPLMCTLCGFKCNKRLRMLSHLRRHTGEKKKPCKICGEYYYYWQDFEHYQNCPKPTPYNCSICDYGTRDRYKYLRHLRLHTGERPYKCRRCGSGFIDTVSQRKHFKTHLKEKLFQCHICHKRFKLPQNRENHVISFSSKKCPKCDYVCINCEDYYLHIKQFHGQSKLKIKLDRYFRELAQYSMSLQQNFAMYQQFPMEQQFPIEEKFSVEQQFPIEEKFSVEQQFPIEEQFSAEQQFPIEPEIVYDLPQNIKYEYASEADNLRTVMYINLG